jgi:hypothetical protein
MRFLIASLAFATFAASAQVDPRFCGAPARNADGSIKRSTAAKAAFVRMHPCPANGQVTGACPGWSVDHVIPLACGGCDAPQNMQWLDNRIKSCAGDACKDRWERRVYQTSIKCQ